MMKDSILTNFVLNHAMVCWMDQQQFHWMFIKLINLKSNFSVVGGAIITAR